MLIVLGCSLLAVLLVMGTAFAIGRATGKYSIIDVLWGPGFAVIAVVAFVVSLGQGDATVRLLMLAMVVIWGMRLGGYLLLRNRGLPEDRRYVELLGGAGGTWAIVRKVQVPQGLAMWFVSLPVQVAMVLPGPAGPVIWVGLVVYLIGLFFESFGDAQLAAFKKDPANAGQLLDRGLWRYTRHPNYFGDACVWTGIFLLVSWSWLGWLTVLSPVVMTWLLIAKTGQAMTEKHLSSSKPGYADYVRRTSGFFPLPQRSR